MARRESERGGEETWLPLILSLSKDEPVEGWEDGLSSDRRQHQRRHPGRAKREPGPIDWTIVKHGRVLVPATFMNATANPQPGRASQ